MRHAASSIWSLTLLLLLGLLLVSCGQSDATPNTLVESQAAISTTPTHGATGVATNTPIQITFDNAVNKASVESAFNLFAGTYDPSSNPATWNKLRLTSMCDGTWRVSNSNAAPLSFTWDIYGKGDKGVGVVPASGDVFFYAPKGANTVRLFVSGKSQQVKAANTNACGTKPFSFTWSSGDSSVAVSPGEGLVSEQAYTAVLSTNSPGLTQAYIFSFTTSSAAVSAQPETQQQVPIPYTVDSEIQGGVELVTTARKPAEASGTVDMYLSDTLFNTVLLLDADGEIVAFDVVAKGIKETVTFSYENSAKADIYVSLTLTGLTFEQLLDSYSRIEAHPRFKELVALHRAAGRVPLSDEAANLSRAIAVDIYDDFQSDTSQITTQTVIDGFGGDGSVSFDPLSPQDPNDPRKVNLSISGTSIDQRLFVFEGKVSNLSLDFLNSVSSVPVNGSSYIGQPPNFYGFRPVGGPRPFSFTLDVPEDDCKVYTLVTSAFARGKGNSALSQEDNPSYANFANAVGNIFTLAGVAAPNKSTVKQLIDAAYPAWVISETGVTNSQKFANALQRGDAAAATEAMFDTLYDGARAVAETAQGESLPEIIVTFLPDGLSATKSLLKSRISAALAAPAAGGLAVFASAAVQEHNGDIKSARFSTGDPEIELISSTNEIKLSLEESDSGVITVRNTGCRDLEYEAGHVYINNTFYSFDLQVLEGAVPPDQQGELPFTVTCADIEDSGLSKVSASDKDLNSPFDAKIISDDVNIDITCGLSRLEVDARHLFGVRGGSSVISNALGDVTGFPAREHFNNNPIEVYVVEPGTQEVRLGVEDGWGYLVLGLKKTFELEPGETVRWSPSANLSTTLKTVYDGPVDDCERLQGVFTVDIEGVFDVYPEIPISQSAMYINDEALNIIERTKIKNKPLSVDARTIRSCNIEEQEHRLGWDIEHNFFNAAPEGFYAFIDGPIDNIDNRWPSYTWNRTDIGGGDFCLPIEMDVLTEGVAGRPDILQNLYSVLPGAYGDVLMRFETLYEQTFRESSAGGLVTMARFSPGFIDRKFTYNGTQQWVHTVGSYGDPECNGAGGMSSQSLRSRLQSTPSLQGQVLFETLEKTAPIQQRRKGF